MNTIDTHLRHISSAKGFYLLLFMALFMFTFTDTANAQFGFDTNVNPAQVRASNYSDAQLRMGVERIRQEGYTVDQALMIAQQQGVPASEIAILRQRIQTLDLNSSSSSAIGQLTGELQGAGAQRLQTRQVTRPPRVETEMMRQTFGSEIFRERISEYLPTQNLATPVSYILGPGDELVVNIWGDQINTHQLIVSPEGTVDIQNLGPVYVNGLNVEEANERIIESLQQIYSGLQPGSDDQTTFARVSINRLRTIQVSVITDAVNPGEYAVTSNATVFDVLYRAGGPNENGSYRNIRVIRDNEIVAELDLYDYIVDGIQNDNIRLRDQDVVQVTPYRNRVFIEGEVKRSDLYYEIENGETLEDLIRFAGYFSDNAYRKQITIRRNTNRERQLITVDQSEFEQFSLQGGDEIVIDEILNRFENRVSVSGAVWRSGEFQLTDDMTLYDLIMQAGGLRPDAFLNRGLINRLNNNFSLEQRNFDLGALMNNPEIHDIPLQREDHIVIRSIHELNEEQTVQVNGSVHQPGTYNYRQGMTLEDLIFQSNGLTDAATESRIEVSRRITGESSPEQRGQQLSEVFTFSVDRNLSLSSEGRVFELQPYDLVIVYRRPDYQEQQMVSVTGQALYPGDYPISSRNERVSDLVERAGGITQEAYLPGARLIRQYAAIDRPNVQFDFLSEEEIVDEEGVVSGQNVNVESQNSTPLSPPDSLEQNPSIEERRITLNQENYIAPANDSTMDERNHETEIAVAIDLAEILRNPGSSDNLFLREGDVLHIPEAMQTVAVTGAVMQDVEVRYRQGMSLRQYIDQAGGFASNAREGRVFVVYPNGDVDRRKQYLFGLIRTSPRIEPGSQIIIPAKPPRERMDMGEFISVSAAVVGMTTSLIIAIDRIGR